MDGVVGSRLEGRCVGDDACVRRESFARCGSWGVWYDIRTFSTFFSVQFGIWLGMEMEGRGLL